MVNKDSQSTKAFNKGQSLTTNLFHQPHVFRPSTLTVRRSVGRALWSIWRGILEAMENRLHHGTLASNPFGHRDTSAASKSSIVSEALCLRVSN